MIDVKNLAKQACLVEDNFFKVPLYRSMGASSGLTVADLEAFAALVLEVAAVECDSIWQEDGSAMQCREAIRALKPAKEQKT